MASDPQPNADSSGVRSGDFFPSAQLILHSSSLVASNQREREREHKVQHNNPLWEILWILSGYLDSGSSTSKRSQLSGGALHFAFIAGGKTTWK